MRCSDLFAGALALAFATFNSIGTAHAECFVCDEVVELTEAYAACYSENFDQLLDALDASPTGRQQVNLAGCVDGGGTSSTRGGLVEMGGLPPGPSASNVKSIYIFDRASAVCLRDLIAEHAASFDPSTVFRLADACADGG